MAVVGIPVHLLMARLGRELSRDALVTHLQHLGCDVEGYATVRRFHCGRCDNITEITETENPPVLCDRCAADFKATPALLSALGESDVIRMELLAVRPDMFEPGGLARVLRAYLAEDPEPVRYAVGPARLRVSVDPSLAHAESFRPAIGCAVVRGFTLSDELIKVIMKLQENLHWALGRDRKRASIGVYDLATLHGTAFRYRSVAPEELAFTPLGYDPADASARLTPQEILERHPKGLAYARLLAGFSRYPLLEDEQGQVLSLPPIINSEQTRLTRTSRDFFLDVTGTEERIVAKTLNMLVTSLAELDRDATLEAVTIVYPDREAATPDLAPQEVTFDVQAAARRVGVSLSDAEGARLLRRMGHEVKPSGDGGCKVLVPAYRNDIMHPVDLAEDLAIAYGYHNIVPTLVPTLTVGADLPVQRQAECARRSLTGLGYHEVLTLILSSEEQQYDALRLPREERAVLIENPISVEQTIVRTTLLAGLLDTFSINTDHVLPQRIFEVGNVTLLDAEAETGAREWCKVAAGAIGPRVDYAEIRSACEALLREFGWELEARPDASPCFIGGRGAAVVARRGDRALVVGKMGELHPEVLERFKLAQPTAVFELDLALVAP